MGSVCKYLTNLAALAPVKSLIRPRPGARALRLQSAQLLAHIRCGPHRQHAWHLELENAYCRKEWRVLPFSAMSTISLKLPDSLLLRLDQESRQRRMTKSALVRAALERELDQPETAAGASCYDLARDLAGSLKKLPKDLATNPKYMEGFGR